MLDIFHYHRPTYHGTRDSSRPYPIQQWLDRRANISNVTLLLIQELIYVLFGKLLRSKFHSDYFFIGFILQKKHQKSFLQIPSVNLFQFNYVVVIIRHDWFITYSLRESFCYCYPPFVSPIYIETKTSKAGTLSSHVISANLIPSGSVLLHKVKQSWNSQTRPFRRPFNNIINVF